MTSFNLQDKAKGIYQQAKGYVQENEKLNTLIDNVVHKLGQIEQDQSKRQHFFDSLNVMIRMVKAHLSGEYKSFSSRTLLMTVFALLYFVIPTDLIPDFIPAMGLIDDISVVYYVVKSFAEDIEQFRDWEATA